jgi:hypothetical protein
MRAMADERVLREALDLLRLADSRGRASLDPEFRREVREFLRGFQPPLQEFGLYRLHWKTGGSSLAAVGGLGDGTLWFGPINWTSDGPEGIASIGWYSVEHAVKLEVLPCEHGRSDDGCLGCALLREGKTR